MKVVFTAPVPWLVIFNLERLERMKVVVMALGWELFNLERLERMQVVVMALDGD